MHFISSAAAGGAEVFVRDLSIMAAKDQHSVVIVFMDHAEDVARDVAFETGFLKDLAEAGIQYEFIGSGARKNLLKGAIKLRQIVKRHKPDILHCHLYYAAIFSLFVRTVPVIYTHHNYKIRAPRKIYRILDLRVSAYIGICFACYNLLRSVSSRPVIHIDNGVATDRLKVKPSGGANPKKRTRVVMVGALTKQKNYSLIIRALSLIHI